ncbi:MAG TPA: hypothetical protein VEC37_15280, partial [Bacillota bacterium]|nr:hypothetical protein [Bacillota bacterium]
MKAKKYQFCNRFLVKDPTAESNVFAFRELKKTACWIMVNPLDDGSGPENNRLDIEQILGDFAQNPTMSEIRLRQYLRLIRKRLRNTSDSQLPPPSLFMMVTDYSRIVWAIAGDLQMYRVRNGSLKFEGDDWHLLNYLRIKAKPGEVRSDSVYLKDDDLIFLCNAEIGQKISDEFLYRTITDFKDSDESAEKAKQFLIDVSQDQDYRMAFISVSKLTKRDYSHDLKDCRRSEVMMPVLLMACFGMLAIYEIECQKMKHALFIPNTIALHHKQLTSRKIKAAIPLKENRNEGQAGSEGATLGQPVNNLELTSSSSIETELSDDALPQDAPLKTMSENVTVPEQPVVATTNLPPAAKAKPENNPKP